MMCHEDTSEAKGAGCSSLICNPAVILPRRSLRQEGLELKVSLACSVSTCLRKIKQNKVEESKNDWRYSTSGLGSQYPKQGGGGACL